MGAVPAVAVLYIKREVAGDEIVLTSVALDKPSLGINKPLFEKDTSSPADASGADPVELIPTFWEKEVLKHNNKRTGKKSFPKILMFFM